MIKDVYIPDETDYKPHLLKSLIINYDYANYSNQKACT